MTTESAVEPPLAHLDDRQIIRLMTEGGERMREELARRRRLEVQWSGTYQSGNDTGFRHKGGPILNWRTK